MLFVYFMTILRSPDIIVRFVPLVLRPIVLLLKPAVCVELSYIINDLYNYVIIIVIILHVKCLCLS